VSEVFERFTDRARRVLVLAQEEARLLNHTFIGTEHILLGLIAEGEGVAAKTLEALGVRFEAVRDKAEETVGTADAGPGGSPPFTPRAKKVLEFSLREALQLGHSYIGTEHILLGLALEGEGVGAQILVSLGADLGMVRQEVINAMTVGQASPSVGSLRQAPMTQVRPPIGPEWAPPSWDRPSEGTLHSVLAVNELVMQSDLIAIGIDHLEVYPNGFIVSLIMRVNPRRAGEFMRTLGPGGLSAMPRVRVRFADGRATRSGPPHGSLLDLTKDEEGIPTDPYLSLESSRGGAFNGWQALAWVHPLPPDGPLEIFVSLDGSDNESSILVDGSVVRDAAVRARAIWT
jgi:hypothetical protein